MLCFALKSSRHLPLSKLAVDDLCWVMTFTPVGLKLEKIEDMIGLCVVAAAMWVKC